MNIDLSFAAFKAQVARELNRNPHDNFVEQVARGVFSAVNREYEALKQEPIYNEYLICPDIFYGAYLDMLDFLGNPQGNEKILDLGIGTGGHLMFYPNEIKKRIVGLDKNIAALKILSEKHPEIIEVIHSDMNRLHLASCSPLYGCIGANTLYHAKDFYDLRQALANIDKKITGKNSNKEKSIIHMFSLMPEDSSRWGGLDLSNYDGRDPDILSHNYNLYFHTLKKFIVEILEELGYNVVFKKVEKYKITSQERINYKQRELLNSGVNGLIIKNGYRSKAQIEKFNDEVIKPGEFVQFVTYDLMMAKKNS